MLSWVSELGHLSLGSACKIILKFKLDLRSNAFLIIVELQNSGVYEILKPERPEVSEQSEDTTKGLRDIKYIDPRILKFDYSLVYYLFSCSLQQYN